MRHAAFTLVEILVSIAIFAVTSTIMLGALFGATEVFRRGEAARQAGDEATAVLAALRADLAHAVPVVLRDGVPAPEGGWFYARTDQADGNCVLSFVVENPDRLLVSSDANSARKIVSWYVVPASADPTTSVLYRTELVWDPVDAAVRNAEREKARDPVGKGVVGSAVTSGCLHFGVWVELAQAHRPPPVSPSLGWEDPAILPYEVGAMPLDTSTTVDATNGSVTTTVFPQPDAIRISMVLTGGGRFATRGTLIGQLGMGATTARVSGIKALPTVNGSLLRINNEWVRYEDFRGGRISGLKRGQLRSKPDDQADRSPVFAGQPFSLVVALPR